MSLTFKFPEWKIHVTANGVENEERWEALPTSTEARDQWTDDLESLGGSDSEHETPGDEDEGLMSRKRQRVESGNGSDLTSTGDQGSGPSGVPSELDEPPCEGNDAKQPAGEVHIPAEVLLVVSEKFSDCRDLCSAMLVCTHWYEVLSSDLPWLPLFQSLLEKGHRSWQRVPQELPPARLFLQGLPRRSAYKSLRQSKATSVRFGVLMKGHEFLREALHGRWEEMAQEMLQEVQRVTSVEQLWEAHQQPAQSTFDHNKIRWVLAKLTRSNWTLTYEAMIDIFTDRADRIAYELQALHLQAAPAAPSASPSPSPPASASSALPSTSAAPLPATPASPPSPSALASPLPPPAPGSSLSPAVPGSSSVSSRNHEVMRAGPPPGGLAVWRALLERWKQYRVWVRHVSSYCGRLNAEVDAERGRTAVSSGRVPTPRLADAGLICFRSQVLLAYGLREVLQHTTDWLVASTAVADEQPMGWHDVETLSEADLETLVQVQRLLQEVDVSDDTTQPAWKATQDKLWRCFGDLMRGLVDTRAQAYMRCA